MSQSKPKTIRCKAPNCHTRFAVDPARPYVRHCSVDCGVAIGLAKVAKIKAAKAKSERKDIAARKERLKTKSDYTKDAQKAWNSYVRARDFGKPCCSCGAPPKHIPGGHNIDCSHYRSVGSAPHMRFNLHNAAAACVKCNRDLGGNVVNLRKGLVSRIGLEKIEAVEENNDYRKFDNEYLIRIARIFNKKAKRLIKRRSNE